MAACSSDSLHSRGAPYCKIKVSAYFFDQAGREIFQNHAAIPQFDG